MIREQINALPVGSGSGIGNTSRDLSFLNREEEFGHLIMVGKWPLPHIILWLVGSPSPLLWLVSGPSPLLQLVGSPTPLLWLGSTPSPLIMITQ